MRRLFAIVNVIAWSGFWGFGFLAVTSGDHPDSHMVIAAVLAFAGFLVGIVAYRKLAHDAEARGYARKTNQLSAAERERSHAEGGIH